MWLFKKEEQKLSSTGEALNKLLRQEDIWKLVYFGTMPYLCYTSNDKSFTLRIAISVSSNNKIYFDILDSNNKISCYSIKILTKYDNKILIPILEETTNKIIHDQNDGKIKKIINNLSKQLS